MNQVSIWDHQELMEPAKAEKSLKEQKHQPLVELLHTLLHQEEPMEIIKLPLQVEDFQDTNHIMLTKTNKND